MNRWAFLFATGLFAGQVGFAWAQSKALPPHHTPLITPATSGAQTLNKRWKTLKAQIRSGLKNGKLTRDQAAERMRQLKAAHHQSMQLKKQNANRSLSTDQQVQVNKQLDDIASGL
jgi:serine phosphatase RsbU (regulator of sigma subunit)